jgi:hypothetical protein
MAKTLLQQRQAAINALKDRLLKIDPVKQSTNFARVSAQLRRAEKDLERNSAPKPESVPTKEKTLVSGLTGSDWRLLYEAEHGARGHEPKADPNEEAWLQKTFPGEDTSTDPEQRARLIEHIKKIKAELQAAEDARRGK